MKKDRMKESVLASLLLSATVLLFVPLQLFLGNFFEFMLSVPAFLAHTVTLTLAVTLGISLILLILPRKIAGVLVSVVAVIGILAWFQSLLNPGSYGVFNGRPIDWACAVNRRALGIDLALWCGGALLLLILFRRSRNLLVYLSVLALITQLIGAVSLSVTTLSSSATPWWKQHSIDTREEFVFSSKTNVIVLVVDTFQATLVSQIMDESPELFEAFDGFTYYPDTVGGFPVTQPSIPLILTGAYYDNSKPFVNYIKEKFEHHSLPAVLKEHGFRSEFYPMVPISVYPTPACASNLLPVKTRLFAARNRSAIAKLIDAGLFRSLPQPAKRWIHNDGRGWIQAKKSKPKVKASVKASNNRDVAFLERLQAHAQLDSGAPVFKFYHLNGIHSPLTLNENMEAEAMNESRGSYRRQAIGILKIMGLFVEKLKEIDAYDQSVIVMTADHGFGAIGIHDPAQGEILDDDYYRTDSFMGGALPMLLVKSVGAEGAMRISNAQATLADIPVTVCSELGIDSSFTGFALTRSVRQHEPRLRRWYTYAWTWLAGNEYLQPLQEYLIRGNSWHAESWRPSGTIYQPGQVVKHEQETVKLDTCYEFGEKGNGWPYLEMGWSRGRDAADVWSTKTYASIGIPVPPATTNLAVVLHWQPFLVQEKVPVQKVSVYVQDEYVEELLLTKAGLSEYRLELSREQIVNDRIKLAFRIPTATPPVLYGIGADQRTLGVALRDFTVIEVPARNERNTDMKRSM